MNAMATTATADICNAIQERIVAEMQGIRNLRVEVKETAGGINVITLCGITSAYYLKQRAQEIVFRLAPRSIVDLTNNIEVV